MVFTLEERFKAFLCGIRGVESIDVLDLPTGRKPARRADFLLHKRRVIVELKALKTDTSHKVEPRVDKHRSREDFPLFYGKRDLQKLLARLPDGAEINRRIYLAITRSVEDAVRSAEEQISETRASLNLPDSVGLLVLLNETIDILSPDVVGHRVATLMRRPRTGRSNAAAIDFVWLLFESHLMEVSPGLKGFPSMLIRGEGVEDLPWFEEFIVTLQDRWATANYASSIDGGSPAPDKFSFTSAAKTNHQPPSQIRAQDLWALQYDARSHLRSLSDGAVLAHGAKVIRDLAPLLKGSTTSFSREAFEPLLREFTCFLQEANFRGLDMRDVPKP